MSRTDVYGTSQFVSQFSFAFVSQQVFENCLKAQAIALDQRASLLGRVWL